MSRRYWKDLRKLDRDSPEYWEELLRRQRLTMDAGKSANLTYVGNSMNIEAIQEKVLAGTEGEKPSL
jgi:hypothetical protein